MSAKSRGQSHGPSWTEVILGAVLSVVLGVVLAAVSLLLKPVIKAKELPKEPVAGAVYFLEGSADSSKAKQALAKQNLFAQGRSVAVTEDELNALVAPAAPAAPVKGKAAPEPAPAAPVESLSFGTPNFRIRNGEMQIGVPMRVGYYGLDLHVMVQARGGFSKGDSGFVFTPSEVYVGSCPVHRLPSAEGWVTKKILAAKSMPAGVLAAWDKLAAVSLEGSTLKLTMP